MHNQQQPSNSVQIPFGSHDNTNAGIDSPVTGTEEPTEPAKVVDIFKRTVKDDNQKVGRCTDKCRIQKNTSTKPPVYILTGQDRMEYCNNSVSDGEWEDALWLGDGTLSTGFDGETYEDQWMKGKRDGLGIQ